MNSSITEISSENEYEYAWVINKETQTDLSSAGCIEEEDEKENEQQLNVKKKNDDLIFKRKKLRKC